MTFNKLKDTLADIVKGYFASANVIWSQGNQTKPQKPYITLKLSSTGKSTHSIKIGNDGVQSGFYPSEAVFTVEVITKGKKINIPDCDPIYKNTAVGDLMDFCLYLESEEIIILTESEDITIEQKAPVLDITALLDGVENEYRASVEFDVYYTQEVKGAYNVSNKTEGTPSDIFTPTDSGGRTEEIVNAEIGYFEKVNIESEE